MYIILFRYGRGEDYKLYGHYNNSKDAEEAYWENVYDFLSYGPDDISELHFLRINKASGNKLNTYIASSKSQDSKEFVDLMNDIYNNGCLKHYHSMNGCYGNDDIAQIAKKDGIEQDDLWENEELYRKYLTEYISELKVKYLLSKMRSK